MNSGFPYTSIEKDMILSRKDLDFIQNGNFRCTSFEKFRDIEFIRIYGVARFWEHEKDLAVENLMADILCSIERNNLPFVFSIVGDSEGIRIYIGTLKILLNGLGDMVKALYPGTEILPENRVFDLSSFTYGGMFMGIPTNKLQKNMKEHQIETILRGMTGKNFTFTVLAEGIGNGLVMYGQERLFQEMNETYKLINQTVTEGSLGNIQGQLQDFSSKDYLDDLIKIEEIFKTGASRGMWRVSGYYSAESTVDARILKNLIKAAYSGEDSKPEAFRTVEYNNISDVLRNLYKITDPLPEIEIHPLGKWTKNDGSEEKEVQFYKYRFQSILNSNQLAVLCQLPQKEFPGYYVDPYVEFDVSNRKNPVQQKSVILGDISISGKEPDLSIKNQYSIDKNDLNRHALIIGVTGGGKTNTAKSLLTTLWDSGSGIPFLVIESAKREYWEMKDIPGLDDLVVFTLGAESQKNSVRYRINPFEACEGISLQTHIDYLMSTFKAAFELYPPMPYLLERAVYEVYSDRGWDIVENCNRYGFTEYPTLSDLYYKLDIVVNRMGYHKEVESNVKAALKARIYSLMIGGKGAMLNTSKSIPLNRLLSLPVVMELEDLGDDDSKAFVIGILMVQLYEYRKSQGCPKKNDLQHILLIEEAHRLLKKVTEQSEGGNTRAKSVEFFCNMLAEIRSYGQGIMIADQIPTKLAEDTIKNTNLKIIHRTLAKEDREIMGNAMNMTAEQIEYLSSLKRGFAAVYAEGDSRPKCVKMPLVQIDSRRTRQEVIDDSQKRANLIYSDYGKNVSKHQGCAFCEQRCRYYSGITKFLNTDEHFAEQLLLELEKGKFAPSIFASLLCSEGMQRSHIYNVFQEICCYGYLLSKESGLSESVRQQLIAEYLRYRNNEN